MILRVLLLCMSRACDCQTVVFHPGCFTPTSTNVACSLPPWIIFEPPRDKTKIRPVRSESSLCAQCVAKDPSFLHADSDDSDETGRMPRLI